MKTISSATYSSLPKAELNSYRGALDESDQCKLFPFATHESARVFATEYGGDVAKGERVGYFAVIPTTILPK